MCSLYPCICISRVLQCTIVFENSRSTCFFFNNSFSSKSIGFLPVLVGKDWPSSIGALSGFIIKCMYSYPAFAYCQAGSRLCISDSFIAWMAQNMVKSSKYYGTSSRKYGQVFYNQSYLVLIIARDLRYLHSNHHVTQGLGMLPSCSISWNVPGVIVEVLDQACYPRFHELRCDAVHAGPRINEDSG